ncbi:hypothetical protein Slala04_43540 [Streptomyces lavendulae subsp. lavendulae]|nr:hypothetical protein Slala04_43540 [Streptomyces lavendulae subsp. lavendulae]
MAWNAVRGRRGGDGDAVTALVVLFQGGPDTRTGRSGLAGLRGGAPRVNLRVWIFSKVMRYPVMRAGRRRPLS